MTPSAPVKIDVQAVLAQKLGKKAGMVPRPVVRYLERLVCQDAMNELLEQAYPRRGADFCDFIIEQLGVSLDVRCAERMPADLRVIVASNHPLGGLDGVCMISWLRKHYGVEPRFLVNDILMAVEPLSGCFIPVNKHGIQSRTGVSALDSAMNSDVPVVVYPAGLVSRRGGDGAIADLRWQPSFIHKALKYNRPVVPVHFDGLNSMSFYRFASLRKRVGIKFNIEMVLLPREVFRASGKRFTLTCGRAIPCAELGTRGEAATTAQQIRKMVYSLNR